MRTFLSNLLALAFGLLCIELLSALFFHTARDKFNFYDVSEFVVHEKDIPRLGKVFNHELGWKSRADTPFGERAREKDYKNPMIATFGDSFTFGDGMRYNETYQTYLSRTLVGDVFNFGNRGYGTDQAYLRFQQDYPKVRTPVAIMGLITENINRTVNVYRPFYYSDTGVALTKPRFVLDGKKLKLLPNPIKHIDEIKKLSDPEFLHDIGANDWWYQHTAHPKLTFPYTSLLFNKNLWQEVWYASSGERNDDIEPRPWENLWQHHPSRELYFAILDAFVREAKAANATPIILILPTRRALTHAVRHQSSEHSPLIMQHCAEQGYHCIDLISQFAAEIDSEKKVSKFFDSHLNAKGNRLTAKLIHKYLVENKLVQM